MVGLRRLDVVRAMDGSAGDCVDVRAGHLSATGSRHGERDGGPPGRAVEILTANGHEWTRINGGTLGMFPTAVLASLFLDYHSSSARHCWDHLLDSSTSRPCFRGEATPLLAGADRARSQERR